MPYIPKAQRRPFYPYLNAIISEINSMPAEEDQDGALNFVIFHLLSELSWPRRYHRLNRALGVLQAVSQEYYRRVAAPYEDEKIKENGDLLL